MKLLNLGCGTKTSSRAEVTNIDWSIYLRFRKNPVLRAVAPWFLSGDRLEHFRSLADNIMVHNLAKGIPFESDSVDVVYHAHLMEHLDRDVATSFQLEVKRVLRPGGIQRIVVPDLEMLCNAYLAHIRMAEADPAEAVKHDEEYIAPIIEQSVRREALGTSQRRPLRRFLENAVLGDARRRGETHQWMYDRVSLSTMLVGLGYRDLKRHRHDSSSIPDWNQFGLDFNERVGEYRPDSLYMEARK